MILISGQAGVGKSMLAKLIAEEVFRLGLKPVFLSFASPLKEDAVRKGYSKEDNPVKYREYCQEIGAARREEDPDYWVVKFDESLQDIVKEEKKDIEANAKYWERVVIVDDCRYVNELAYGVLYNATTLFMAYGERTIEDFEWRKHPSEEMSRSLENGEDILLHQFSDVVYNDSSESDLIKIVKANVPIWCGTEIETDEEEIDALPLLQDVMDNLMDMLFLSDPEEEEEEEDEDTEDSDS